MLFTGREAPRASAAVPPPPSDFFTRLTAAQIVTGGMAYLATLSAAQAVQLQAGITTASRVAGMPLVPGLIGFAAVGTASLASLVAADAVAALAADRYGVDRPPPLFRERSALATAAVGLLFFRISGGRFWAISPSSLSTLGAYSRTSGGSLPAGLSYATASQRATIQQLGRKLGCHTCGTRFFNVRFNADHMPPLSEVKIANRALWRRLLRSPMSQRFYPQCTKCSSLQGGALAAAASSPGGLTSPVGAVFHWPSPLRPYNAVGATLVAIGAAANGGLRAAQEAIAAADAAADAAVGLANSLAVRALGDRAEDWQWGGRQGMEVPPPPPAAAEEQKDENAPPETEHEIVARLRRARAALERRSGR